MADFNDSLGFLMAVTSRKHGLIVSHRLKPYNLTIDQWTVLNQIQKEDGLNQKEIALRSGKDQPSITRILDLLYEKNFIYKKPSPTDRRSFLVYATEEGKKIIQDTYAIEQGVVKEATAGLTPEQIEQFKATLLHIYNNVEQIRERELN